MKYSGTTTNMLSSLVSCIYWLVERMLEIKFLWESITPFGRPVVPDVYTTIATSVSRTIGSEFSIGSVSHISVKV